MTGNINVNWTKILLVSYLIRGIRVKFTDQFSGIFVKNINNSSYLLHVQSYAFFSTFPNISMSESRVKQS